MSPLVEGYARIAAKRHVGGVCFLTTRMNRQECQCIIDRQTLGNYAEIVKLPIGSLIYIVGHHTQSLSGTPSVQVETACVVAKSSVTVPDKHHGLSDHAACRNRTLDLVSSPASFGLFHAIAKLNGAVHRIFHEHDYLNFETGILQERFEGGLSNSFSTRCNTNNRVYHLALTAEMKLKKLVCAGFERVYEVTRSFRNEGINATHYPEFGIVEAYAATDSLEVSLEIARSIMCELAQISTSTPHVTPLPASFTGPIPRIDFVEALGACGNHPAALSDIAQTHPDMFRDNMPSFTLVYKTITKILAPHFHNPTFIVNIPQEFNPFCRVVDGVAAQAILVASGLHIATLSVDENDPEVIESRLRVQSSESGVPINNEYLDMLRLGAPPISGLGLGTSRIAMLLLPEKRRKIRNVLLFPPM